MPQDYQLSAPSGSFARGRSLLGRFKTPLASWNKSVADFQVEPDDPWRCYAPGDVVSGCVVLTVIKPIRITHVVVCLHGHARVFKNQTGPSDGLADAGFLGAGRGRRGTEYHGNGFLTLFEDEVVLCGDGRLKEGVYKFKFELEFPTAELPSSIEFERGVVGYNITATVTRPTAIAPTLSCERRVHFQDAIDIAAVSVPRPKIISLEPISKRGRVRNKVVASSIDQQSRRESAPSVSRKDTDTSTSLRAVADSVPETVLENEPPRSPALSESSQGSIATESSQSFRIVQQLAPSITGNSLKSSEARNSSSSVSEAIITATTELLRPGALPGDSIPIKVSVKHTKPVRGIALVTLYRQGRIDMHPVLPMGPQTKGKAPEYEHLYPRSKTGLGGLHFSNATPSSIFRKDLSQSTAPMIINPATLTAEIKASVKLPEDAFPTIVNVPGAMIMFKYFVEVVVDLCGKLNESRLLPKLSLTTPSSSFAPDGTYYQGRNLTSNWADRIIDTDPIRRTKTIVSCVFELVVGSRDTSRAGKKWADSEQEGSYQDHHYGDNGWDDHYYHPHSHHEWTEEEWKAWYGDGYEYDNYWPEHEYPHPYPPQHYVPPPELEEQVDEKTRLRRAEELLLPSQPPPDGEPGPSSSGAANGVNSTATAPWIPEENGAFGHSRPYISSAGASRVPASASGVSSHSIDTVIRSRSTRPEPEPPRFEPRAQHQPRDDKQDLERQRLMAEASAPPAVDGRGDAVAAGEPSSSSALIHGGASAPMLSEEDEYQILSAGGANAEHGEHLPQYQR